uniref:NADH dehydrogenase subunit 6 n=1 Tax=Tenguella granulata TaxID=508942 RepID=UPI002028BC2E|nr:NADH dehydrogenase subunit 6 [Tenguella granulata]UQS75960.1 NADH dehydrogenase subunit 6 [Tenguella granulata]
MTTLVLLSMTISSLFLLPLMSQPLSLGMIIMSSTLMICVISAITLSSWYAYILFLIYVGGLLVMFAYVAALSPNVLFGKGTPLIFFMFMFLFFMMFFFNNMFIDLSSFTYFSTSMNLKFLKIHSTELVSPQMMSILIGLATILLINLIVVVKICYYTQASLRPFST